MKKPGIWLIAALSAIVLLAGYTASFAYHATAGGSITLKQADGSDATSSSAYSPKATCARACHLVPDGVDFAGHTYGTGSVSVAKNHKVITSGGTAYEENYNVASFAHGASVGRHMNQGRNEPYSAAQRTTYGDPFFTSSPGMAGKY